MKILQQCIYFPPEVGGLESHAYFLCRELVRMGHDVTMMTSLSRPGLPTHENMHGVNVIRKWFPKNRTPAGWAAPALLRPAVRSALASRRLDENELPAVQQRGERARLLDLRVRVSSRIVQRLDVNARDLHGSGCSPKPPPRYLQGPN